MTSLILPLKRVYFDEIADGTKTQEYRLVNAYWTKRLVGRSFDQIILTLGYPPRDCESRRIIKPWRGFSRITIAHPHFGADPVEVFAIEVGE